MGLGKISSVIPDMDNYPVSSFDQSVSEMLVVGNRCIDLLEANYYSTFKPLAHFCGRGTIS
jgi:hypothetical protein